ncbi:MAG: VanZ family protein [Clostridia bacterium]|nr:VanZ family protein [Clostridia bacterium]
MQDQLLSYPLRDIVLVTIICSAVWVIIFAVVNVKKPESRVINLISCFLMLVWLFFVLYITLLGRQPGSHHFSYIKKPEELINMLSDPAVKKEKVMNVMLFLPLGLFVPCMLPRHFHEKGFIALIYSALLSSFIEYSQYKYMLGTADIYDIVCNVLGGLAGYVVYLFGVLITFICNMHMRKSNN